MSRSVEAAARATTAQRDDVVLGGLAVKAAVVVDRYKDRVMEAGLGEEEAVSGQSVQTLNCALGVVGIPSQTQSRWASEMKWEEG